MPSKRAVVGWILVSYVLIAGGFTAAAVAVTLLRVGGPVAGQAAFFIGALIGGLVAGRASRHKAVVEPAIAGLLLAVSLIAVFMIELGWEFSWRRTGQGALGVAITLSVVSGLGGFVGGLIGRRSRTGAPSGSALRWWGVAMLMSLGASFILVLLVLALAGLGGGAGDDKMLILMVLSLVVAAVLGGFITQALTPQKMLWTCGAGSFSFVLLTAAFSVAADDLNLSATVGSFMLCCVGSLFGVLGALLGWNLIGSRIEPPPPVELPEVRLRS